MVGAVASTSCFSCTVLAPRPRAASALKVPETSDPLTLAIAVWATGPAAATTLAIAFSILGSSVAAALAARDRFGLLFSQPSEFRFIGFEQVGERFDGGVSDRVAAERTRETFGRFRGRAQVVGQSHGQDADQLDRIGRQALHQVGRGGQ